MTTRTADKIREIDEYLDSLVSDGLSDNKLIRAGLQRYPGEDGIVEALVYSDDVEQVIRDNA